MGLFFLSDINLRTGGETTALSIFISETKPEKSVDPQLRLNSAFLVASGRLSFVNVL